MVFIYLIPRDLYMDWQLRIVMRMSVSSFARRAMKQNNQIKTAILNAIVLLLHKTIKVECDNLTSTWRCLRSKAALRTPE